MIELLLKFAGDKIIPLILIGMAAVFYKLQLPETFSGAVGGAGLLAFQISRASPANPTNPNQGPNP